jgi:chemotaxis protein methyltransferase CheR
MPVKIRHSCFQNKGKQWEINPEFKTGVSFQFHNLVEDPFPPPVSGFLAFDLIVCRNVMIYFGPEQSRRIVRQFHDALEPGAWLVVGPSEPNMTYFTFFRAVNEPGVTLYQRPALPAGDRPEASALPEVFLPFAPGGGASQPAAPLAGAAARPALPVVPELAPAPTLADLRQRADQGDWEGAARFGKGLTETDNLNPLAHFHYALVLEQMGDYAASERSFRKAIYLDRQTALAHYHLGLLLQSRGHRRQAMRCFDNTLEVLASRPGDSLLLEAGEITVAELSKLVRMRLEILRAEVAKEPI